MKVLKICSNEAEAGFLVSLLASEGVASFTSDAGVQISGVSEVRLEVSDADFAAAEAILCRGEAKHTLPASSADLHPAVGYPFLGIAGLVTVFAVIVGTILNLYRYHQGEWEAGTTVVQVLAVSIAASTFFGFVLGSMIAFAGLLARPMIKKMKGGEPGATDNPDDAQRLREDH